MTVVSVQSRQLKSSMRVYVVPKGGIADLQASGIVIGSKKDVDSVLEEAKKCG